MDSPRGCVLVVEDDVALRNLITTVLERAGLGVDQASDGVEAIALLERRSYSVVLLDLVMPNMSGHGVIRYLNDRLPEKPPVVIVVSAEKEMLLRELDDAIVAMFVRKPLDIDSLLSVVKSVHRLALREDPRARGMQHSCLTPR